MLEETLHTTYPDDFVFTCDDRPYNPNKVKLKTLYWKHYDYLVELDRTGKARPTVLENIQRCLLCNTIYLGYDAFECPNCNNENLLFRHCHSRVCNSCGVKYQKQLAAKAEVMCIDVRHRHIVFTIPEEYRVLFRIDRSALNVIFVAARNTICKVINKPIYDKEKKLRKKNNNSQNDKDNYYAYRNFKHLRQFGMIATLHTFGRDLKWNPHVHCLVAEAYYDPTKNTVKNFHTFNFTFLRKVWQYELNRLLLNHFGPEKFRKYMNYSYKKYKDGFYVYAKYVSDDEKIDKKSYSENVAGCVNYMMRYASRPAMAESRINSYNKDTDDIEWFYDDHKTNERIVVKEKGIDLLKKLIIHIPDKHFSMIRYYGFYNNKNQDDLDHIHELLGNTAKKDKQSRKKRLNSKLNKFKFRTFCIDSYNRDVLRCKCGTIMKYVDTYNPLEGKKNDREYREECINEMRKLQLRRTTTRKRSSAYT